MGILRIWALGALLLAAGCAATAPELPDRISGRVIWVHDGDTVTLLEPNKAWRVIRLYGIDAPELAQPYGVEARNLLIELVGRRQVSIEVMDIDRYGRTVGKIYRGTRYINLEMIQAGAAWWYKKYAPDAPELKEAEREARAAGRGLWSDGEAAAPWDYRRAN